MTRTFYLGLARGAVACALPGVYTPRSLPYFVEGRDSREEVEIWILLFL